MSQGEISNLLRKAEINGIDTIDTAISYGSSERRLGTAGISKFKVITKLPAVPINSTSVSGWINGQIEQSLTRLRVSKLYAVLLHHPEQLGEPIGAEIIEALSALRELGVIEKTGLSVYAPLQLDRYLSAGNFDIVQAPLNLLDRRLIDSGWLKKLCERRIETHIRSVFLQGLLLMGESAISRKFLQRSYELRKWLTWRKENPNIPPAQMCLSFVFNMPEVDKVIVGVDGVDHLNQIIDMAAKPSITRLPNLSSDDEQLINPSNWHKL